MEPLVSLMRKEIADEDLDLLKRLREDARANSWDEWLREAVELLKDPGEQELWPRATAVCFWALSQDAILPVPKMELVARLYWCLIHGPDFGPDSENLVWTIAKDLKRVGYESEWDPMTDPEVASYMSQMDRQ